MTIIDVVKAVRLGCYEINRKGIIDIEDPYNINRWKYTNRSLKNMYILLLSYERGYTYENAG